MLYVNNDSSSKDGEQQLRLCQNIILINWRIITRKNNNVVSCDEVDARSQRLFFPPLFFGRTVLYFLFYHSTSKSCGTAHVWHNPRATDRSCLICILSSKSPIRVIVLVAFEKQHHIIYPFSIGITISRTQ